MQNFRHADGTLSSLPTLCIDTGMGLERMARVLQSKENTFQIDQFQHLVSGIRGLLKKQNLPVRFVDKAMQPLCIMTNTCVFDFLLVPGGRRS